MIRRNYITYRFLLIAFITFLGLFSITSFAEANYEDFPLRMQAHLEDFSGKILQTNPRTITKLKKFNDSFEYLQLGLKEYAESPDNFESSLRKFKTSFKKYRKNLATLFMLGSLYSQDGNLNEAAKYFKKFYLESFYPEKPNRDFFSSTDLEKMRKTLEIFFNEFEYKIPEPSPPGSALLQKNIQYLKVFPEESKFGVLLTIITILGLAIILIIAMTGYDGILYKPLIGKFLLRSYSAVVLGYFLWMVFLYTGWKIFDTTLISTQIKGIMAGVILFVGIKTFIFKEDKNKIYKNNPDYKKCPHCKKYNVLLATVCEHCQKEIP